MPKWQNDKSVFSFLCQLTTWHCPHLLLFTMLWYGCCWPLAMQQLIDISRLLGPQQQTLSSGMWRQMLGQTDKQWAPDGCKHPALHTTHCMQWQKLFRIFLLPLTYQMQLLSNAVCLPSVLWRCWLGGRKGIRPVKNWVVRCWRGYPSEARCRLAYGPADATATHCLSLQ